MGILVALGDWISEILGNHQLAFHVQPIPMGVIVLFGRTRRSRDSKICAVPPILVVHAQAMSALVCLPCHYWFTEVDRCALTRYPASILDCDYYSELLS